MKLVLQIESCVVGNNIVLIIWVLAYIGGTVVRLLPEMMIRKVKTESEVTNQLLTTDCHVCSIASYTG